MKFYSEFKIFIQENAFESVVCEKAAILSRPQCVNIMPDNAMVMPVAWTSSGKVSALYDEFITLRLEQNSCHFADVIFCWNKILIKISQKFVPCQFLSNTIHAYNYTSKQKKAKTNNTKGTMSCNFCHNNSEVCSDCKQANFDCSVLDCNNFITNALELLQACTKVSI